MGLLPFIVRLERAVTSFATNSHLGHRGIVTVGGRIVILVQAGVVTFGAERIPVHAPASPMAEFTRKAKIIAINVEPLV